MLCVAVLSATGQPMANYDNLLFPIRPGQRNTLAGTMGELRSTHFHTGIDIRTGGREGLAVLAAADGYVARIKVSGSGYGNTLYIRHPNGKTTVYAHLKSFREDIARYVLDEQYKRQSFEVNLFPAAGLFPVKQGDTLALSGNSGSSGGPHLHFDLRDENQNLLNPLTYGFREIIDTRPPLAKAIALVPFSPDSRINGRFARQEFKLKAQANNTYTADTIYATGTLGMELLAWDKMDGTRFRNGINEIKFYLNGLETYGQQINTWSFARARSFYQHISYPALVNEGKRYHKLYIDDGNKLRFYEQTASRGRFKVEPGRFYHARITMTDSYGNSSEVRLVITGKQLTSDKPETPYQLNILANTLKITGDTSGYSGPVWLKTGKQQIRLDAAYHNHRQAVYLWPLQQGIPQAITLPDTVIQTHLAGMVPPDQPFTVFHTAADITFKKRSLFDTLYLTIEHRLDTASQQERWQLGPATQPLQSNIRVLLKPQQGVADKAHTAVYAVYGPDNYGFAGGSWQGDYVEFETRSLGTYTLLADTVPPTIKPLIVNREKAIFKIDDKLSGIKEVSATLNGQWLLISRDPKKQLAWATKHYNMTDLSGIFKLTVTDQAGNSKTYTTKIP